MDILWVAFLYGLSSAVSFPLGALLGHVLSPVRKDVGASCVAFGAGALLFAVTVEIYGHILGDFHRGTTGPTLMWITITATFVGAAGYLYLNAWMEQALEGGEEHEESGHGNIEAGFVDEPPSGYLQRPTSAISFGSNEEHSATIPECAESDDGSAFSDVTSEGARPDVGRSNTEAALPTQTSAVMLSPRSLSSQLTLATGKYSNVQRSRASTSGVPNVRRASLQQLAKIHKSKGLEGARSAEVQSKFAKMQGRKARASTMCTEVEAMMLSSKVEESYSTFSKIDENSEHKSEADEKGRTENIKLAMALFLGLLVDGIPESCLLGFLVAEGYLSYVLVLSIFLANFPEAFSSASLMTEAGIATSVILGMWTGLCLLTGVLCMAACGLLVYFGAANHGPKPFEMEVGICTVEGLCAGSMICCISAVMLPEAYERRNQNHILLSSGFLCASGFLSAVALKVVEADIVGHTAFFMPSAKQPYVSHH